MLEAHLGGHLGLRIVAGNFADFLLFHVIGGGLNGQDHIIVRDSPLHLEAKEFILRNLLAVELGHVVSPGTAPKRSHQLRGEVAAAGQAGTEDEGPHRQKDQGCHDGLLMFTHPAERIESHCHPQFTASPGRQAGCAGLDT